MQLGYVSRLESDLRRWTGDGLINEETASALLSDARDRRKGYSFGTIVFFLGIVSIGLALLTFVAANWQEMSRIAKLTLLVCGLWGAYGGAVFARRRDHPYVSDALILLGAIVFGAAIMLTGQMYHLQGRAANAVLLWAAGSALCALLLRSAAALSLTIILTTLWLFMETVPEFGAGSRVNWIYPVLWLGLAAVAWWLKSRIGAHLLAIGALGWLATSVAIVSDNRNDLTFAVAAYAFLFVVVAVGLLAREGSAVARQAGLLAATYTTIAIVILTGIWIAAIDFGDIGIDGELLDQITLTPLFLLLAAALAIALWARYSRRAAFLDTALCVTWIAVATFAVSQYGQQIPFLSEAFAVVLSLWFIRMGARHDIAAISRLGYVAFILVMALLYFRTAGSLMGTSGFYLGAGVALVVGALLLPRLFAVIRPEDSP